MKKIEDLFTYHALTQVARLCIVIAPLVLVVYGILVLLHHYVPCMHLWSITNFGLIGDFVGGVISTLFAIAAAMYVIKTYKFVKNCPCFLSYFGKDLGRVFAVEDKAWRDMGERFFETDLRIGI